MRTPRRTPIDRPHLAGVCLVKVMSDGGHRSPAPPPVASTNPPNNPTGHRHEYVPSPEGSTSCRKRIASMIEIPRTGRISDIQTRAPSRLTLVRITAPANAPSEPGTPMARHPPVDAASRQYSPRPGSRPFWPRGVPGRAATAE